MAGSDLAGLNEAVFGGQLRWEASPEGRARFRFTHH